MKMHPDANNGIKTQTESVTRVNLWDLLPHRTYESHKMPVEDYCMTNNISSTTFDTLILTKEKPKQITPAINSKEEIPSDRIEHPMKDSIWAFTVFNQIFKGAFKNDTLSV